MVLTIPWCLTRRYARGRAQGKDVTTGKDLGETSPCGCTQGLRPGEREAMLLGTDPMPERVRIFTVGEANALLPRLNVILERQMALLTAMDSLAAGLRQRDVDPESLDPAPGDTPEVAALKGRFRAAVQSYREGWSEVEALGVMVKDARAGLLDFYGRRGGSLVWLCWKYGEPAVAHWHPLDQGFSARQPLERESIPPTLN